MSFFTIALLLTSYPIILQKTQYKKCRPKTINIIFFVHSKTQCIFFNYNLSLLSESNFMFQDKMLNFIVPSLKAVFSQYQISSCHNFKTELFMFLNMVQCQATTMWSLQSVNGVGVGWGTEGGGNLRLATFLVLSFPGGCCCHLSETSFTRGNVFLLSPFKLLF